MYPIISLYFWRQVNAEDVQHNTLELCSYRSKMHFHEPDWISVEPRNHIVFEMLVCFINSASADPTSVQHFADSTINALTSISTPDPSVEQYRNESRVMFGILFTIITQLDAAAPSQDHLVKLVLSLRCVPLPATVVQGFEVNDPGALDSDMNQDLSKLKNVLSSFEADAPLHPRNEDRPNIPRADWEYSPWRQAPGRHLTADAWASINAFVAQLHTATPDLIHLDLRGLYAMIEALEQPLSPSRLEDVLPTAAYWVIYAGKALKSNDVPYADYDYDGGTKKLPWSKGELWTGQHAFNQARWEFWMQKFKDISERNDVSEAVRVAALRAFQAGSA